MSDNSYENYLRVKRELEAKPCELKDAMEKSIAMYIHEHGLTEVNSRDDGREILKEATEWNIAFGRKDASSAFGMILKQYMNARLAVWKDVTDKAGYEDFPGRTYRRRSS